MYYGQHGNNSLGTMFLGYSENISMEEIYGVDYNSSIYQFIIRTGPGRANTTTTIEVTLEYFKGLNGSYYDTRLFGLSLLSASHELCATFFFLGEVGLKEYQLNLVWYAEPKSIVYMKGYMSLPNQARSFDRLQLFYNYPISDSKLTTMEFSVTSLKFLQKRNTVAEPCANVDNYDKVRTNLLV
jgi:hypothetical protein